MEVIKTKIVPLGIGILMALIVALGTITPMIANGASDGQISASMTVGSPATIGITVTPTSIDFGSINPNQAAPASVTVTNTGTVQEAIAASGLNWALSGSSTIIPISTMTAQFPSGIGQGPVSMSNLPVGLGTLPVSSQAWQLSFVETVPAGATPGPYSTTVTLTAVQG